MKKRISIQTAQDSHEEAMINLTPLIDVVFVMLIMFIVVAPILELDQIELAKGGVQSQEVASSVNESRPITLHVRKDNTILLNKERVVLQKLKPLLLAAKKQHPKTVPLLFHDKKAYFGTYQEIKNTLEECGFSEVDIVLAP